MYFCQIVEVLAAERATVRRPFNFIAYKTVRPRPVFRLPGFSDMLLPISQLLNQLP